MARQGIVMQGNGKEMKDNAIQGKSRIEMERKGMAW
jgi:hypothetical protein